MKLPNPSPEKQVKILAGVSIVSTAIHMLNYHLIGKDRKEIMQNRKFLLEFSNLLVKKVKSEAPWVLHDSEIQNFLINHEFDEIARNYGRD